MSCKRCGVDKPVDRFVNCTACREYNRINKPKKIDISKSIAEMTILSMSIIGVSNRVLSNIEDINRHFYQKEIVRNTIECECAICLDSIVIGDSIYKLDCNHSFHAHCILLNSSSSNTCPVCRGEIMPSTSISELINVYDSLVGRIVNTYNVDLNSNVIII